MGGLTKRLNQFKAWVKKDEDGMAQLAGSSVLLTAIFGIRIVHGIILDPMLLYLPYFALGTFAFVFIGIMLGGIGWVIIRLMPAIIRFIIQAKPGEKLSIFDMSYGLLIALFLGIPSLSDAVVWWHEHLLKRIDGEEEAVKLLTAKASGVFDYWSAAASLLLLVGFATFLSRKIYQNLEWTREFLRDLGAALFKGRDLLFPLMMGCLLGATLIVWLGTDNNAVGIFSSFELLILMLWVLAPLLFATWLVPAMFVALLQPLFVLGRHFTSNLATVLPAVLCFAWMVSILSIKKEWPYLTIPYWLGVAAMAGFFVYDDFYLR